MTNKDRKTSESSVVLPSFSIAEIEKKIEVPKSWYKPYENPTSIRQYMRYFLKMTRMTPVELSNNILVAHATSHNMELPEKLDDPKNKDAFKVQRRLLLNKIAKAIDGVEFEFAQSPEDDGKIKLAEEPAKKKAK